MKKGEYFILYQANFKKEHKAKRLNLVFYSRFMQKRTEEELNQIDQIRKNMQAFLLKPNSRDLSRAEKSEYSRKS
jgi:hypothetical protein